MKVIERKIEGKKSQERSSWQAMAIDDRTYIRFEIWMMRFTISYKRWMLSLISEISSIHLLYIIMYRDYPTWLPGFTLPRREVTLRLPSKLTALRIMP